MFYRKSTQTEEASEEFNNPTTAATFASNNGLPNPGYYGPNGSGPESGHESDPSRQISEELRFASKGDGGLTWVAGAYYSYFWSRWNFAGTTPNFSAYEDLGTLQRATTPNWFDADEPSSMGRTRSSATRRTPSPTSLKPISVCVGITTTTSSLHASAAGVRDWAPPIRRALG